MNTLKIDLLLEDENKRKESYKKAAQVLKNGGTVIFPTETVYGLGALCTDVLAVNKIFKAKGRPQDNPLIIHVADKNIDKYVKEVPKKAKEIIEKFWPGPITILLNKKEIIPDVTTANLKTVGVRMPDNEYALNLLKEVGEPVAAPSANISGLPSPTTFKRCIEDMDGKVDVILGADNSKVGLESTIVDCTVDPIEILRPGGITIEMLRKIDENVFFKGSLPLKKDEKPRAPGMKYTHYSPKADVTILKNENLLNADSFNELLKVLDDETLIISFDKLESIFKVSFSEKNYNLIKENLIEYSDEMEGSKNIFEALRKADDDGYKKILIIESSEENIGLALMNRLKKASGYKIIKF